MRRRRSPDRGARRRGKGSVSVKFAEESWYCRSPIFVQNAVVSAYGFASRRLRNGRAFRRVLNELMRTQWYTEEEFEVLQNRKLSRLIRHCYETVPYYRGVMDERGLKPDDISTTADLPKLPLLTKEIVRTRSAELRSKAPPPGRIYPSRSSGTTGTPLETLRDMRSIIFEQASLWRQWRIAGLGLGYRRATLRGHPMVPREQARPPFWRINRSENQMVMSGFHLRRENALAFIEALRWFKPDALEALPAAAYFLAREIVDRGETVRLKCVLTGSEPLYPMHREAIEKAFDCEVFDFYGLSERVVFAFECTEHTGLHLTPEYGVTEFIEPSWDAGGGLKEIVGTGLNNYAMPLLRYRTGDYAKPLDAECPCGRKMPLLGPMETRVGGTLQLPDGRFMPYSLINYAFMGLEHIRKTQLVQETLDHIVVRLVPDGAFSGGDREKLITKMKEYLGGEVRIDIALVDDIPRERSGKYRWVVSKVRPAMDVEGGSAGSSARPAGPAVGGPAPSETPPANEGGAVE
jgi:phenylacetate-CoA ligase